LAADHLIKDFPAFKRVYTELNFTQTIRLHLDVQITRFYWACMAQPKRILTAYQ